MILPDLGGRDDLSIPPSAARTVHSRQHDEPWAAIAPGAGDVLELPDIGIDIPVDNFFEGLTFSEE